MAITDDALAFHTSHGADVTCVLCSPKTALTMGCGCPVSGLMTGGIFVHHSDCPTIPPHYHARGEVHV